MNLETVLASILTAALLSSMPLMLAAVGESIGERAGVLNLGLEGVMLTGAFAAFMTAVETGSAVLGLGVSLLVGLAIGTGFGLGSTWGGGDQVVLGLGITLAGTGGTAFLMRERYGATQPLLVGGLGRPFDGSLDWLPVIGPALADQRWFVYLTWLVAASAHIFLTKTRWGLETRAAGDSPFGLLAAGGNVQRVRLRAAMIGGTLGGLGGGALSVVELGFFTPGVTSGLGFLAIAMAMLGRLSPGRVAIASVGFGVLTGLDTAMQLAGVDAPTEALHMAPYAGIVIALAVSGRGITLPAALGRPYHGESKSG